MVEENLDKPQAARYQRGSKKGRMKKVKQRGVELSVPDLEYIQAHHIIHFILQDHVVWDLAGMNANARASIVI